VRPAPAEGAASFAGGVTILSLTFDSLTAYALARLDFPGKNVIFVLVLITLMLPFQVNLVPLFLLLTKFHWVNTYQGLILPRATNAFGIFFLRQFFLSIPRNWKTPPAWMAHRTSRSTGASS